MSARVPDVNGWYEIKANPLSKVGIYPYKGSSIKAADPDKIYNVYRPATELSQPDTLNSLKLLPFINDHTMLGDPDKTGYTAPEKKGVQGVIGEDVFFRDNTIFGNIKVFSTYLGKLIDSGKDQLSCGYRCKYVWEPGIVNGQPYDCYQSDIRFNHLALVQDGRMGPEVSVLDMDDIDCVTVATFDTKDFKLMDPVKTKDDDDTAIDAKITAAVDAAMTGMDAKITSAVTAAMDAAVAKVVAANPKNVKVVKGDTKTDPDETDTGDKTGMDAAEVVATVDAAITKATAPLLAEIETLKAGSGKALFSEIAKRDDLARKLAPHIGTFDHSEMTLGEVAVYGAEKLKIEGAKGSEIVAVGAYLHNRTPMRKLEATGLDSKDTGSVNSYLTGTAA